MKKDFQILLFYCYAEILDTEKFKTDHHLYCIKNNIKGRIIISSGEVKNIVEEFDAVVFATHSNQSLRILDQPTPLEEEILSSIPYQKNTALLHYDESILPVRKNAWSSWNYMLDRDVSRPVSLTYNMNILQSLNSNRTFCVSLNSGDLVDKSKVIKSLEYEHPLFTLERESTKKKTSN